MYLFAKPVFFVHSSCSPTSIHCSPFAFTFYGGQWTTVHVCGVLSRHQKRNDALIKCSCVDMKKKYTTNLPIFVTNNISALKEEEIM